MSANRSRALGARLGCALPLALVLAAVAHGAAHSRVSAQPKRQGAAARSGPSLEEVAIMLASSDDEELRSALESAALLPPADVVPLLEERIRLGLSRVLLDVALDSLQLLHDRSAVPLLRDLARHRRPEVRARALDVLSKLGGRDAISALERGVSDLDPQVRKASLDALAELQAADSLPTMRKALEREQEGAARAIGSVARASDVDELLGLLDRMPGERLAPLFEALFAREDMPEAEKLRAVAKLSATPHESARALLRALGEVLPARTSVRLRRALSDGAQRGMP